MMTRADRASLTLGCLLYLGSAPLLPLLLVGISSLPGAVYEVFTWQWWVAVLRTMFQPGDERPFKLIILAEFLIGLVMIGWGLLRAFGGFRFTIGRMMIAVIVVATGLAFAPFGLFMAVLAPVLLTLVVLLRQPAVASNNRPHDARS
jgi:hypothetical protein